MNFFRELFKSRIFLIILVIFTLFAALILRLFLSPHDGYPEDMILFKEWSRNAVTFGVAHIYDQTVNPNVMLPNYMPIYLYFLRFSGFIYKTFISPEYNIDSASLTILLKINAIIFDLATALLIFHVLKKEFSFWAGYLGLILYAFNPAIFVLSGYWGQVDSIPAFFVLLSIILVTKNKFLGAWLFITLATFIKLQSIIFIPIIFLLNLIKKKYELLDLAKNILLSLMLAIIVISPFLIHGTYPSFVKTVFRSVGYYKFVSLNAFNIWWPLTNGEYTTMPDTDKLFNVIPYFYIGLFLFFIAYLFAIITLYYKNDKFMTYLASSFIAFAFFMLPTQIHERYLFPVFAILVMIVWRNRRLLAIYLILSLMFFANIFYVLIQEKGGQSILQALEGGVKWPHWLTQNYGTIINVVIFIYFIYLIIYYSRLKRLNNKHNLIK